MRLITAPFLAAVVGAAMANGPPAELLVVNKGERSVRLLGLGIGETLATLPTGPGPHEIAASRDGRLAVATNYGEDEPGHSLTVLDLRERKVLRTVELGEHHRPYGIAFLPDGRRVAVTTEDSRHLLIVDVETGRIEGAIPTGQDVSHMVALSPDAKRAYVANIGSGTLTVIDVSAGKVLTQIPTGAGAEGVAVTPGGKEIWVTNRAADTVSVVDTATLKVKATLASPGFPIRVALTPDGRHALVTNAKSGELAVFDTKTKKEVRRLKLLPDESGLASRMFGRGSFPVGVIVSPKGDRAFVAITGGRRIAVVDTKTWTVTGYWSAGEEPDGMAIVPR